MKTILVIEDDQLISNAITEFLQEFGYHVVTSVNGKLALDLLSQMTTPHLIVLDLLMPIMDGFDFRRNQLKDPALKNIPMIVMTAHSHTEEKREEIRASHYLKKPFDMFELLKAVQVFST